MKKIIIAISTILISTGMAFAEGNPPAMPTVQGMKIIMYELTSVDSAASKFAALTAAQVEGFREAHISAVSGIMLYRFDSATVTAVNGLSMTTGYWLTLKDVRSVQNFQAISKSTTTGASIYRVIYGK